MIYSVLVQDHRQHAAGYQNLNLPCHVEYILQDCTQMLLHQQLQMKSIKKTEYIRNINPVSDDSEFNITFMLCSMKTYEKVPVPDISLPDSKALLNVDGVGHKFVSTPQIQYAQPCVI